MLSQGRCLGPNHDVHKVSCANHSDQGHSPALLKDIEMEFHELADIFPMMDAKRFAALKADIAEHGLREPIIVTENKILDGRNRYNACLELPEVEPRFVEWDGKGDLLAFIVSMNLARRHLNESQRAMVAGKIANMPAGRHWPNSANLPNNKVSQGDSADMVNVSTRSVTSAVKVLNDGISELRKAVEVSDEIVGERVSVSLAAQVANWEDEQQMGFVDAVKEGEKPSKALHRMRKEQAADEAQNAPAGTFNVILADPPWPYDNAIAKWGPADAHYSAMTIHDIGSLPEDIGLNIAKDAVLFLWVPNAQLGDAFGVLKSWGFQYKTNIAWVKTELKKPGSGWYVRGRHELCFICTRGAFTPLDEHISPPIGSVIEAPVREHSRKPEELYDIVEKLYPGCSYIELFARGDARNGWKTWGYEA